MTVNSPVRASTFTTQLDSSLHRVGCALAGGDSRSIAKAVLSEPSVREQVLRRVSQEVEQECALLCRRQPVSMFRKVSIAQMKNFSWDWFVDELQTKSPVLHRLLMTVVSHTDH